MAAAKPVAEEVKKVDPIADKQAALATTLKTEPERVDKNQPEKKNVPQQQAASPAKEQPKAKLSATKVEKAAAAAKPAVEKTTAKDPVIVKAEQE